MDHILLTFLAAILMVSVADDALQKFVAANIEFTANSFKKQAETEKKNLLVCGISAEIVLSLLTHGAKGQTKTELQQGLSEDQNSINAYKQLIPRLNENTEDLKLLSANRLYSAERFNILKYFKDIADDPYNANIQNVNFKENTKTAGIINKWVEDHTNNRIKDLVRPDQLNEDTRLVLVNTLFFYGKWIRPFDKGLTRKEKFYTSPTETKEVDMMHTDGSFKYRHCGCLKAQFLELPFKANVSMTFILPDDRDGLAALEENVEELLVQHDMKRERVLVSLPKFSFRSTIDFIPILHSLGVKKVFDPQQSDLSGISKDEGLFVSFVIQKTYINVTEEGVEAAAATAVGGASITSVGEPVSQFIFNADHPFIYYIKDTNSGIILFIGKFTK